MPPTAPPASRSRKWKARYQRIGHIKKLMREGILDADLRRRPRAAPRKAVADAVVA